ncbi:MAG TPA: hypothetical protein VFQ38_06495 [Longimicrobiales bacterium]|nr:hypothetical protein [Longimicrobiales bacterium]
MRVDRLAPVAWLAAGLLLLLPAPSLAQWLQPARFDVGSPGTGAAAPRRLDVVEDDDAAGGLETAGAFAGGIGFLFGATIGSALGASRCPQGDDGCKLRGALIGGGTGAALIIPLSVHSTNHGRGKLLPSLALSLAEDAAGLALMSLVPADAALALSPLVTAPLSIVTSAAIERATTPPAPPPPPKAP